MLKIPTIFERDWEGNRGVINKPTIDMDILKYCMATEKLDGTNVRISVNCGKITSLEKRKNPSKKDKQSGKTDPWYTLASKSDPSDKHIWSAAKNTNVMNVPNGCFSGEAIGPKIQGNPLKLEAPVIVLFSIGRVPVFKNVPIDYEKLKHWLRGQQSQYGLGYIEGIVWHHADGRMFKIKTKDFK